MAKLKPVADEKPTKMPDQKWIDSELKARKTAKMANTLAKALGNRYKSRWRFIDFHGPQGRESAGVVDIVAIRKCGRKPTVEGLKRLDLFDIQLIQVKGGSAKMPTASDKSRLRLVQQHYNADRIVLFEWKVGVVARFSALEDNDAWNVVSASELFGVKS